MDRCDSCSLPEPVSSAFAQKAAHFGLAELAAGVGRLHQSRGLVVASGGNAEQMEPNAVLLS